MWRPLKSSEQPRMIHAIRHLNEPARINGLAVLRGETNEAVSALRQTLETWRTLVNPDGIFSVAAAAEIVRDAFFFWPADSAMPFKLELGKKRQSKWDRLLADLPSVQGLRITSEFTRGPFEDFGQRHAARIALHYTSPAPHSRLPEYAARLGHVSLSLPASPVAEQALVLLMQKLATEGLIAQAYVSAWNSDDEPKRTLYEDAADTFALQRSAQGWGGRYLRAVADRLWLGAEFASMLTDRVALEGVAEVESLGNTLAIRRRREATLRDLELCLEPMLASQAESKAFAERFRQHSQPRQV